MKNRYQYLIVITIVVVVFSAGFYIANDQEAIEIVNPKEDTILNIDDFSVNLPQGQVVIGSFAWEEVNHLLPEGETLGRSTIYSPRNLDCLFTFTKKENILCRIHINEPGVFTSRNIGVGDRFDDVIAAYGGNYGSVAKVGNETDLDIAYGADSKSSIYFHIRDNIVSKIILQNEPAPEVQQLGGRSIDKN